MAKFLYACLLFTLSAIAEDTSDSYDLLELYKTETSSDEKINLKFDNIPSEGIVLPEEFFRSNLLTVPFIIHTTFKLDEIVFPCLFSIENEDGEAILRLCLMLASGDDDLRITLSTNKRFTEHSLTFHVDSLSDTMNLILHVSDETVGIKVNCYDAGTVDLNEAIDFIAVPDGSKFYMARTGRKENKANIFEGEMENLIIYSGTESDLSKTISKLCTSGDRVTVERNEKGQKGEPGESLAGPRGPVGPPGRKGEKSVCQCSESVVSSLIKNMPEMRGPPGDPGPRGDAGDAGPTGMTGKPGVQGERGPQGVKGETGERGDDGLPGIKGNAGLDGSPGKDGIPGPPGPRGLTGPPGPPGPGYMEIEDEEEVAVPGEKGEQGPIGPPGPIGERGNRGEKGDQGLRGEKGDRGHMGPEGSMGVKGKQGESGLDGVPGTPGKHGHPGSKGDKGDKGDSGLPGMPARLSSILNEELDPIEKDEIIKKLRGNKGATGSSGLKGEKGSAGELGPPGISGEVGRHGHPGAHGSPGPIGPVGPKGETGDKGDIGPPGPVGPPGNMSLTEMTTVKGSKGDHGLPGNVGSQGPKGARGPGGPRGHRGPNGKPGQKGQKGDSTPIDLKKLKGEKGERGDIGLPGVAGKDGEPGSCLCSNNTTTTTLITGPPGPPGPPGAPGPSITGQKGEPGDLYSEKNYYSFSEIPLNDEPDNDDFVYTTTTVIYKTTTALIKKTSSTPLGTLAYVLQKKILLLRVESGWQHVMMGSLLDTRDMHTASPRHIPNTYTATPSTEPTEELSTKHGGRLLLVALNSPHSGKIIRRNGIGWPAAEVECHKQAKKYLHTGSFTAFLANSIRNLQHLVAPYAEKYPVINLRGETLFSSWSSMFDGRGAIFKTNTDIHSFDGKNVMTDPTWPHKVVWHGSDSYGNCTRTISCGDWNSDKPTNYGSASSLYSNALLREEKHTCDNKYIVLCVETTPKLNNNYSRMQRHYMSRREKRRYNRGAYT